MRRHSQKLRQVGRQNAGEGNLREVLLGSVFLVMGLLQVIPFVIRTEPRLLNVVLGAIFIAGGFCFAASAFLRRKSEQGGDDSAGASGSS